MKTEAGMAALDGGSFTMGSDAHYPEERPARLATVNSFEVDKTSVTNRAFNRFVAETGYITSAEVPMDPDSSSGMPPEYFVAGSLVFHMTKGPVDLRDFRQWWRFVPGADWRHPEGPESSLNNREDHPVVQVSLHDALAYCEWSGKKLPTEAEWEFAARDGVTSDFPWGDTLCADGIRRANTWTGDFPWKNLKRP